MRLRRNSESGLEQSSRQGMLRSASQCADFVPAQIDQRPDDAGFGHRANPAEARGTRAAQEAVEDGFGLIVESVAGGDGVASSRGDLFGEKFVPARRASCSMFPVRNRRRENVTPATRN